MGEIEKLVRKYNIRHFVEDGEDFLAIRNKKIDRKDMSRLKKLKPEIIEFLKKESLREKEEKDPTKGPLGLHYYFGDWYRVNAIFRYDTHRIVSEFPFTDPIIKEYFGNYVSREKVTKVLDKLFNVTLETDICEFLERFDDLDVESTDYNDLRGSGRYIEYVIFPDWKTFEKYVAMAVRPYVERKRQVENEVEKLRRRAIETKKEVEIARYSVPCNDLLEECNVDIIIEYFAPDGKRRTKRIHMY